MSLLAVPIQQKAKKQHPKAASEAIPHRQKHGVDNPKGSLLKENLPLCPVQRHRRCHPSRAEHGIFFLDFSKKVKENKK